MDKANVITHLGTREPGIRQNAALSREQLSARGVVSPSRLGCHPPALEALSSAEITPDL